MKKVFPWILTFTNISIAIVFCVMFFITLSGLPDIVPVHWTANIGIDRWGAKSELYSLAIIPTVTAALAFSVSIGVLVKKSFNAFVYISNGISLLLLLIMIMASVFIINQAFAVAV